MLIFFLLSLQLSFSLNFASSPIAANVRDLAAVARVVEADKFTEEEQDEAIFAAQRIAAELVDNLKNTTDDRYEQQIAFPTIPSLESQVCCACTFFFFLFLLFLSLATSYSLFRLSKVFPTPTFPRPGHAGRPNLPGQRTDDGALDLSDSDSDDSSKHDNAGPRQIPTAAREIAMLWLSHVRDFGANQ